MRNGLTVSVLVFGLWFAHGAFAAEGLPDEPVKGAAARTVGSEIDLTLLTWNVQYLNKKFFYCPLYPSPLASPPRMKKRARAMAKLLESSDADIVGINEAFATKAAALLYGGVAGSLDTVAARQPKRSGGKLFNGGLGLMASKKLKGHTTASEIWRDCTNFGALDCPGAKGILYTRLETTGGRYVNVFVVHVQAGGGRFTKRVLTARASQLAQLREMVELYSQGGTIPTFLIGDFNIRGECAGCTPAENEALRQEARDLPKSLEVKGLGIPADAYQKACPSRHACEDPGYGGATNIGRKHKRRLDFIFFYEKGKGWTTTYEKKSLVVDHMFTIPGLEDKAGGPSSDHYALKGTFSVAWSP